MGKISKEDMPAILPVKRSRLTLLRSELQQLDIGEGYFLPKEEWKTSGTPSHIVTYLKRTHGVQFQNGMKTDGTGWLFKRIK